MKNFVENISIFTYNLYNISSQLSVKIFIHFLIVWNFASINKYYELYIICSGYNSIIKMVCKYFLLVFIVLPFS